MVNLIIDLVRNFISGSTDVLNSLTNNMFNMVFYMENELAVSAIDLPVNTFNQLHIRVYWFALLLAIMFFIKKLIETYFFWQSGDPDTNPVQLVIRFIKTCIVMTFFGWFYGVFVSAMNEFFTSLQMAINPANQNIGAMLEGAVTDSLFIVIACLLLLILLVSLAVQFITRGIEMLILRISIPLACIGLLNSDGGAFTGYTKKFIQNSFTVIVQILLVQLSVLLMSKGSIIYAIATALIATKTPTMINEFMITAGAPKVSNGVKGAIGIIKGFRKGGK